MNPDLLQDPRLRAAFDAASEDAGAVNPAVDMLLEREASLGDVLMAFAGTPPDWSDGMPQSVLAKWLEQTEPSMPAKARTVDGAVLEIGFRKRWKAAGSITDDGNLVISTLGRELFLARGLPPGDDMLSRALEQYRGLETHPNIPVYPEVDRVKAITLRDRKRRVLSLFPEVKVTRQCVVGALEFPHPPRRGDVPDAFFEMHGFRLDLDRDNNPGRIRRTRDLANRRWVYTQTLAAPDWIAPEPPEPSPYWGWSRSTPLEDIRAMHTRILRETGNMVRRDAYAELEQIRAAVAAGLITPAQAREAPGVPYTLPDTPTTEHP